MSFIKSIRIRKVRHLENILIEISDTQRKHLILTSKNGSGKTSLLEAMYAAIAIMKKRATTNGDFILNQNVGTDKDREVEILIEQPIFGISNFMLVYIPTARSKLELSNAFEENHEKWFDNLLESLQSIYNCNKSAIAMIDGIETHLHIEMQKKVLPFLVKRFPNVQFIITTHSPFVITSLENAIVYDLGKNERLENPSFYSYDTVVKSFLDTSMYSDALKGCFAHYKELCFKHRTPEENEIFLRVKAELEIRAIPSTELYISFQELEKARKAGINELM